MKHIIPLLVLALGVLYLASSLRPHHPGGKFNLSAFGELPVLLNGRIKPLDTVARTSLLQMQESQTVRTGDTKLEPIEWLTLLVFEPAKADALKTFKIVNPEVLALMHLTTDDGAAGKRFSFDQLRDHVDDLEKQVQLAGPVEAKKRSAFQSSVLQLYGNITTYHQLRYSLQDPDSPDFLADITHFAKTFDAGVAAVRAQVDGKPHDKTAADAIIAQARRFQATGDFGMLLVVPPPAGAPDPLVWKKIGESLIGSFDDGQIDPTVLVWAGLGHTWSKGQPDQFNELVGLYRERLAKDYGTALRKTDIETRFNAAAPFYTSMALYVAAFLLAVISWLRWPGVIGRCAVYLLSLAAFSTTIGLITRMWLESRPPVTNLYSSAVFIGWIAVLLCLALEFFYRNAIATAAAGLVGFCTLLIAHHLSLSGDTLEMMRAVLDSNFWLATHVTVVTIGYSATFVAAALAIIYIVLGVFTPVLNESAAKKLTGMIYGIVCFATLFSLVGTILGGIWADQSWGRFWGWDPKENGALMIVLWNAIILHCRWGGLVKQRGLVNLAIVGGIITSWSWFGTNLLGVGLHSYGFTENGALVLGAFMISQLILIGLSFIPKAKWRSSGPQSPKA
ncbi:MAG: cytochrome c biogenesis protein CcsA [Opitutaceae bacterium]|jgi:ABC-type transport system involved in cytochrome c biogenesis permease subunit